MRAYKTNGYEEPVLNGGTQSIFTYYHSEKDQGWSFNGMFLESNRSFAYSNAHPCTSVHHVVHPTMDYPRMTGYTKYWVDTVTITRNDRLQLFI